MSRRTCWGSHWKDLDVQLLALALPRVAARRVDLADQREVWGWAHGVGATAANLMVGVASASLDEPPQPGN